MQNLIRRYHLKTLILALFISSIAGFMACQRDYSPEMTPEAVKGSLDLTSWDFNRDGPVDLIGDFEFYWMQHLEPNDFTMKSPRPKPGFIKVPSYWVGHQIEGEELPGHGYATLRLNIALNKQKEPLALRVVEISTAYRVYVNGQRVASLGEAGESHETTVPLQFTKLVDFELTKDQMELIFQVSNFHHRRGGTWKVIQLGREEDIRKSQERRLIFDFFLLGSIFIMALYHLGLFIVRKEDPSPLYFSFFCFMISLRIMSTGCRYLVSLFPDVNWELLIKLEYLSFYLAVPVFSMFMRSIFPKFSKRVLYLIIALAVVFSVAVISTPARLFTYSLNIFQTLTLFAAIYGLYVIFVSMRQKRIEAFVFLIGFILLCLGFINDTLHAEVIVQTDYYTPFGLFFFILSQSFLLSYRFSTAIKTVESQRKELRDTLESYKTEIMERVGAEEALRISHERFLTVLDSIDANVYVADMETYEILFMNRHMRDTFGQDLIGQTCWRVFRNSSEPCKDCTNANLIDTQGRPTGVYIWEGKNPITEKWYINYDRAIKWVDNRLVRLKVATDVTELKQTEEALRESEEKYRTILNSIEEGYYEVDLSGNMTFFNESLSRQLGYPRNELMGMNNRQYMSDETAKRVYETFNTVLNTGKAAKAFDWEMIAKDGTKKFVELSVSLMRDSEGQPMGFRGVARDISERKKAEEQSRLHQQQLMHASKMVALGTLVSGVAHEVNNPNNFIMLNSPILKEAWDNVMPILEQYYEDNGDFILGGMKFTEMSENIPILFSGISDGAKRIKQIVDDLKNYVRDDTIDLTQSIDMNEVLKSTVSLLSNMIKKSTDHFRIEYGKNLPLLKGNFQHLEQVMINLIQNACQALPDTNKGIFVSVRFIKDKSTIVIKVRDQGMGMPPEILNHISDPFFTTRQDTGGVGLGLSISSTIVEEHGGTIHFESEIGVGTSATLTLPVDGKNEKMKGN